MRVLSCDLHIHSTLSPCSSLEMSPREIVLQAKRVGLDVIAVTDHNMVENGIYAHEWGRKTGLGVLFGMELQTREEIHLLVLFDDYSSALAFQKEIYELLPDVDNDPEYFGDQAVVDGEDNILRFEKRLLLNSARISIEEAVGRAKKAGAIVIPSHIDSDSFSIISQLGFVPEHLPFDALEIVNRQRLPEIAPFIRKGRPPLVSFSDAHYLADIGRRRTALPMEAPTLREIKTALEGLRPQG